jgi:hypothetical protein
MEARWTDGSERSMDGISRGEVEEGRETGFWSLWCVCGVSASFHGCMKKERREWPLPSNSFCTSIVMSKMRALVLANHVYACLRGAGWRLIIPVYPPCHEGMGLVMGQNRKELPTRYRKSLWECTIPFGDSKDP